MCTLAESEGNMPTDPIIIILWDGSEVCTDGGNLSQQYDMSYCEGAPIMNGFSAQVAAQSAHHAGLLHADPFLGLALVGAVVLGRLRRAVAGGR